MAYKHRIYDTNQGGFKAAWRYSVHKVFGNSHLNDESYENTELYPSKQDFPILVENVFGGESLHSSIGIQEFFNPFNYIEFLFTLVHAGVDELTKLAFLKDQYSTQMINNAVNSAKDSDEYKALDTASQQTNAGNASLAAPEPVASAPQESNQEQQPLVQNSQALADQKQALADQKQALEQKAIRSAGTYHPIQLAVRATLLFMTSLPLALVRVFSSPVTTLRNFEAIFNHFQYKHVEKENPEAAWKSGLRTFGVVAGMVVLATGLATGLYFLLAAVTALAVVPMAGISAGVAAGVLLTTFSELNNENLSPMWYGPSTKQYQFEHSDDTMLCVNAEKNHNGSQVIFARISPLLTNASYRGYDHITVHSVDDDRYAVSRFIGKGPSRT